MGSREGARSELGSWRAGCLWAWRSACFCRFVLPGGRGSETFLLIIASVVCRSLLVSPRILVGGTTPLSACRRRAVGFLAGVRSYRSHFFWPVGQVEMSASAALVRRTGTRSWQTGRLRAWLGRGGRLRAWLGRGTRPQDRGRPPSVPRGGGVRRSAEPRRGTRATHRGDCRSPSSPQERP